MVWTVWPARKLEGEIKIPADKSISHRAVIISALAKGESIIEHFLNALDTLTTVQLLQNLGVSIQFVDETTLKIKGKGKNKFQVSDLNLILNCGNSGTTARLMMGILSAQSFKCKLIGDSSLSSRPMRRVIEPLSKMGANLAGTIKGPDITLPIAISPVKSLNALEFKSQLASAQLKSSLLLAGLCANVPVQYNEPLASRNHTENMLIHFGAQLNFPSKNTIVLKENQTLIGNRVLIPGDFSSAAFFIAGAAMTPGSDLTLINVGINPTRTGLIHVLLKMGACIKIFNRVEGAEPAADIRVIGQKLKGVSVSSSFAPSMIDEYPILMIAAVSAEGETHLKGISELRFKESDRISVMVEGLKKMGAKIMEFHDKVIIEGGYPLNGTQIETHKDHRVAMAFAMASLLTHSPVTIKGSEASFTSFPNFKKMALSLGLRIESNEQD